MMNPTKLKTLKPIPDTKSLIKWWLQEENEVGNNILDCR